MFVAKFVKGPMDGREMELEKLELTVHVKLWVDPGEATPDDEVSFQKGTYIREANPRLNKTSSKHPYNYVWDGWS